MAAALDLAVALPEHDERQVPDGVLIAVGDAAAEGDEHVIEQRAVAVGRRLQLVDVVREELRLQRLDLDDLRDLLDVAAVVRQRVVRVGDADLAGTAGRSSRGPS